MPVELKVPSAGESISEVFIGKWYKAEGDRVNLDENLVELESDKATFDFPAPAAGVITKILKQTGATAKVGEVIGYLDAVGAGNKAPAAPEKPAAAARPAAPEPKKEVKAAPTPVKESTTGDRKVMPAAQRVLAEQGLRPEQVESTGPGGRVLKEDVLRQVANPPASTANATVGTPGDREEQIVPMSPIRRRIPQRLVEAQHNAALLTTFNEIDMSSVMAMRQTYKDAFVEKYGVKLGFMSFFVKAAVEALKLVPQINAEVRGTDIVYKNYYDIGIAIGGGKGLVVPSSCNVERLSFADVEKGIADFGQRAQKNKLAVEELQGGTFTISNGGIYGSLLSTPIVNPPQSGVLGMHSIQERPVARNGAVVIRPMMYVALTYDHRVVDGREAVTFLKRIKEQVEDPARILIEV